MKQRVAIARALAMQPRVLLMDEPFAALDALTRRHMQEELLALWDEVRFTLLFVTHSIEEALVVGNRVALLSPHPGRMRRRRNSHVRPATAWARFQARQRIHGCCSTERAAHAGCARAAPARMTASGIELIAAGTCQPHGLACLACAHWPGLAAQGVDPAGAARPGLGAARALAGQRPAAADLHSQTARAFGRGPASGELSAKAAPRWPCCSRATLVGVRPGLRADARWRCRPSSGATCCPR